MRLELSEEEIRAVREIAEASDVDKGGARMPVTFMRGVSSTRRRYDIVYNAATYSQESLVVYIVTNNHVCSPWGYRSFNGGSSLYSANLKSVLPKRSWFSNTQPSSLIKALREHIHFHLSYT